MESNILGIDIAKDKFDVALISSKLSEKPQKEKIKFAAFENNTRGFKLLLKWISDNDADDLHACMEATGGYSEALGTYLHECGYKVSIVNPSQICNYAKSELSRNKTDKTDAAIIARFCRANRPHEWKPLDEDGRKLKSLTKRMGELEKMLQQEKTRLKAPGLDPEVKESIIEIIDKFKSEIEAIRKKIREHVKSCEYLRKNVELLDSIPGIGEKTAFVILGLVGEITRFSDVNQFCAWTGVVASKRESGKSVRGKPRMSRKGNAAIRKAMFMPALVAMEHNPVLKKFKDVLKTRNKNGMTIVVAVMHKLLRMVYGVLKNQKPFDPESYPHYA